MLDVVIDIKSSVVSPDGEAETININTVGHMRLSHGTASLYYSDSGDGWEKTTTVIKCADGAVNITRTGDGGSQITVCAGRRCQCSYYQPFGRIEMGISGKCVEIDLNEDGGSIFLDYDIDVKFDCISRNRIEINVRRLSKDV